MSYHYARTKLNILGQRFGCMPKDVAEFFDFIMPKIIEKTHERVLKDEYKSGGKEDGNEKTCIC